MDLLDLFVKITVDDQASNQMDGLSAGMIAKGQLIASGIQAAVSTAINAIKQLVSGAVNAYSQYEQLAGGMETFFGDASQTVITNAEKAYKTAGMSANDYMATVTSFATALVNGVAQQGKQSAAESEAAAEASSKAFSRSLSDQLDELRYAQQDEMSARREAQQEALDGIRESQAEEVKEFQDATNAKIKEINREYTERMKLINEEEYQRLKSLQDQIDGIEAQEKASKEQAEQRERAAKIAALKEKEANSMVVEDIEAARKELSELQAKYAEEDAEKQRRERIDQLKDEQKDVRDAAAEKRAQLREQQQVELEDYREARANELEELRKSQAEELKEVQKLHADELQELQRAHADELKEAQRHNEDLMAERKRAMENSSSSDFVKATAEDQQKAAELADRAIIDMADNANKMGTSIESIQYAYQGFAKGNFTMLDNLKLGFGGTKEEMERLLDTAEQIQAKNGETAEYSIDNFADIVEAIHVVQQEYEISGYQQDELRQKIEERSLTEQELARIAQDLYSGQEDGLAKVKQAYEDGTLTVQDALTLTGTTSKEAATTIEGSTNSMMGAWENWLLSLSNPDIDAAEATTQLIDSVGIAAENIIPRFGEILGTLFTLVKEKGPEIFDQLKDAIWNAIPEDWQDKILEFKESFEQAAGPVIDFAKEHLPQLLDALGRFADWVTSEDGGQAISNFFSTLGEVNDTIYFVIIKPFADAIGIIGELARGFQGLDETTGSFDTNTSTVAHNFGENIRSLWDAVTHFSDVFKGACDEVKGFFSDMGKKFEEVGSDIDDTMKEAGKQFDEFGKGIDQTIKDVIKWFKDLPQNIVNALGNLGNLLENAGHDLINGFWKGLKDGFDHVKDWVHGIGDWIRDNKGPKQYDLSLLVPNGEWIMQGLADGMRGAFPLIEDTVSDIAGLMNVRMPDVAIADGYQTQGLPPVNVYMTYNAGEDARELVGDFVGQLRRYGYTMGGKV